MLVKVHSNLLPDDHIVLPSITYVFASHVLVAQVLYEHSHFKQAVYHLAQIHIHLNQASFRPLSRYIDLVYSLTHCDDTPHILACRSNNSCCTVNAMSELIRERPKFKIAVEGCVSRPVPQR
jgi:hypothetical protein